MYEIKRIGRYNMFMTYIAYNDGTGNKHTNATGRICDIAPFFIVRGLLTQMNLNNLYRGCSNGVHISLIKIDK